MQGPILRSLADACAAVVHEALRRQGGQNGRFRVYGPENATLKLAVNGLKTARMLLTVLKLRQLVFYKLCDTPRCR